ncbi:hypothetical protein BCBMB205_10310 [Bacillus sp. CN2]|nr:hypothetical protein BCBMB205_10310 [Bacillus velezensis]ARZ57362.1 hypothetical protein BAGQ_1127 [Bacillus velezensis]GFR54175.1 hypothetical protein BCBMB205_10310 [Bacillus sp. CN2]
MVSSVPPLSFFRNYIIDNISINDIHYHYFYKMVSQLFSVKKAKD